MKKKLGNKSRSILKKKISEALTQLKQKVKTGGFSSFVNRSACNAKAIVGASSNSLFASETLITFNKKLLAKSNNVYSNIISHQTTVW